jgi:hypothetical protein
MAGTTPNLGLYLPGGGSTGTYVPDEVADIDTLNQNFLTLDTAVGDPDEQNRQWYGPAANIGTLPDSPKDGDTYQESDGSKILWRRVGGVWVTNENGAYLIRPNTLVNASVNTEGYIVPNSGAKSITVDGAFSTRFKRYRLDFMTNTGDANGSSLCLRAGGVEKTSGYDQENHWALTNTAQASSSTGGPSWGVALASGAVQYGWIEFTNMMGTAGAKICQMLVSTGNNVIGHRAGYAGGVDATQYDGFRFFLTNSAANAWNESATWWRLSAIA